MLATYHKYDVCLSFAGTQRSLVEQVADNLRNGGFFVFYDDYEETEQIGTNLMPYFSEIYRYWARQAVVFVSEDYVRGEWPQVEWQHILARAKVSGYEYVIPVRLDDSYLEGLPDTQIY